MEIKLIRITLKDFKGIKLFEFDPDGKNATIRGDNATGKTTVADAFRWLLFGKDTADRKDFAIKTLDKSGAAHSNMEHSVNAVIEVDGTAIELKKTYKEKWTKKRGYATKNLTGHTTDHFIDGVPISEAKWKGRIGDLIDEDQFKLIILPSYFNSLKWQDRRRILLDVCGDVLDEDVLEETFPDVDSKGDYEALVNILNQRTLDDHRKVVDADKRKINDRLKEIPARIDELNKTLPTDGLSVPARNAIEAYLRHIDHKIEKIKDNTELAGYRKQLADAEVKLSHAKADIRVEVYDKDQAEAGKVFKFKSEIRGYEREIGESQIEIDDMGKEIKKKEGSMAGLRILFKEEAAKSPQYDEICAMCNQPLPKDQIETSRRKFKVHQAGELIGINDAGKKLERDCASLKAKIGETTHAMNNQKQMVIGLEMNLKDLEKDSEVVDAEIPKHIVALVTVIADIGRRIDAGPKSDTTELEADRREEHAKLAALDAAEKTKARIENLKMKERDLGIEFEELEKQIFLMEKFIVAKVGLLEGKINSKFQLARFKLFETQINEGIKETCITTVAGVPYGYGLNKGMEINVGLDIIETLSEHYNITAPVWIDNAEAITAPLEIPSQTFKLIVEKDCPHMEVDYG
ncbi:hypothetical protein LCGC14_0911110 [marine sediment metagenome]|uniref:Rad50/SbcC-type AAA domain-containing protein n=1 Tax=marine sediment metagenome TaxID=412755 RepID=A0A0F9NTR9_9ZZZZ